jgi:type I restriction enzyme M protein
MNLYIHDIKNANLAYGDTLLYPKFKEGEGLKQFDVVIANPPWNQDGYDEEVLKKGEFWKQRFRYGFVPKLPEKLFYNTGAPGALVFLNKNKPEARKLNRLGEVNIQKIADAYRKFGARDGFVRAVTLDEIKNNDYNLNVTLYVFPQEKSEEIDVDKEWQDLRMIEEEIAGVETKIEGYLKEIMAK